MSEFGDFLNVSLPPLPEGATGRRIFHVGSETVYPWWLRPWLYRHLPEPLSRWAGRFLSEQPRYVELTWQEFLESRSPVTYPVSQVCHVSVDEPPRWDGV